MKEIKKGEKNKKTFQQSLKYVPKKWLKIHWKIIRKVIQNGAKIHEKNIPKSMSKFDAKKGSAGVGGIRAAVPQEHLQINKITCR